MSEDDTTLLEQEAMAQLATEENAFNERFPPEAFTEIAKALKVRPTLENLSRLRGRLLPEFYYLHSTALNNEPTRKEQIDQLQKVYEAASTLHSCLTAFNRIWLELNLPIDLFAPDEGVAEGITDPFIATLQQLADAAASSAEKLASKGSRKGRPPKNTAFREFTPILIRTYESVRKEPAGVPYYLPDSGGIYGSKGYFYRFAAAVWRCLQKNLPEKALVAIPSTEGGLAQELIKHWPKGSANR
jgi:hypothetical protein